MTRPVEAAIRAAAVAHRATGVPLSSHTSVQNRSGELLANVLLDEGVDMRRVVIGHSGDSDDRGYLRRLLETGAFLGMDRFGSDEALPDVARVQVVAGLCREGYSRQLLLSHDATAWNQWRSVETRQKQKPYWQFQHLFGSIVPALRNAGVSELQVNEMLVENPRRLFSMNDRY
jgi:phosphotriesterase-related protein